VGCISLLNGIELIRNDRLPIAGENHSISKVSGRSVLFNPPITPNPEFQSERFWEGLK
jgi:hypothetical protein